MFYWKCSFFLLPFWSKIKHSKQAWRLGLKEWEVHVERQCYKETWRGWMKVLVSSLSPPLLHFHSAPKLWRPMKDLPMSLWPHWYSALQFGMIIIQDETALKTKILVFTPNICAHLIICKQTQVSHAFLPSVVSCYSSPSLPVWST